MITSSSWRRSIGQPFNSKSTGTWAEMGVEVRGRDVLGVGVDDADELALPAKLRRAWTPPDGGARADGDQPLGRGTDGQDPFCVLGRGDGTLDQRDVVRGPRRGACHLA